MIVEKYLYFCLSIGVLLIKTIKLYITERSRKYIFENGIEVNAEIISAGVYDSFMTFTCEINDIEYKCTEKICDLEEYKKGDIIKIPAPRGGVF